MAETSLPLTRPCHQLWPGAHIPGNGSSFFTLAEALGFFIPPPPHFQQDTNAGENRPSPRLCTDPPQPARVLASPAQSLDQTLHYHMAGKPSGKSVLVNPVRKNNPKARIPAKPSGGREEFTARIGIAVCLGSFPDSSETAWNARGLSLSPEVAPALPSPPSSRGCWNSAPAHWETGAQHGVTARIPRGSSGKLFHGSPRESVGSLFL